MHQWLVTLACLSLFFPSALQADNQPGPAENTFGSLLPFRLSSGYLIEVEGRIGNRANLKFILDTGATISIVGQRIAQNMKLDAHRAQGFNFDRNLQWETAIAPEVQFGRIRATNVAVLVGDLARYSAFASDVDAVIGMDLLRLSNFTIDYSAGHLIFDPGPLHAYLLGGDPMTKCLIVELQVQGRPVHLLVDSGQQFILMYDERLRKSVPGLRTVGRTKNGIMGGRLHVKQATLPDVVFGNKNREVPVVLLPAPAEGTLPGIDGIVGVAAFQARRVHFDFLGKTLSWN